MSSSDTIDIYISEILHLRTIHPSDSSAVYELIEANKEQLKLYFNWVEDILRENKVSEFIEDSLRQVQALNGITWTIIYHHKIIGIITLYNWTHDVNKISIGFWLDKSYQRKGIMQQCMEKILEFLFRGMNMHKIEMYFSPHNSGSLKIAEKFKFKLEGLLRQNFYINGRREDQYVAGLLYHEWLSGNQ